jgi:hypothetical protein
MVAYAFAKASSRPHYAPGGDGRPRSWRRALGRSSEEPAALAFPVRRAGHGAPGRRDVSGSISTGSGTSSPPTHVQVHRGLTRSTTQTCTPSRAACTPASCSSQHSTRMLSTTAPHLQTGRLQMPLLAVGGEQSFGSDDGPRHALCGRRRASGRGRELGPLVDGRAARGDGGGNPGLPRHLGAERD